MSHFSLYFKQKLTAELCIWSAQQNMRIGKAKMISLITIEVLRVLSLAKVSLCIGILQAPPEFMAILSTMSGTSAITLSGFALESSRTVGRISRNRVVQEAVQCPRDRNFVVWKMS